MPRKALDVSRSVSGWYACGKPKPRTLFGCGVACFARICPVTRSERGSRQEYRGINSRRLYVHYETENAHCRIGFVLYNIRHKSGFVVKRKALTVFVGACLQGVVKVNYYFVVAQYHFFYQQVDEHLRIFKQSLFVKLPYRTFGES